LQELVPIADRTSRWFWRLDMANVNPSSPNEQGQYNPVHRVTGLFVNHDSVTAALCDLEEAGFGPEDIDILAGPEGEEVLDPSGTSTSGRWFRKLEDWVSDTSKFQEVAAATLHAGGFVVAVQPGKDETLKGRAMDILTRHGARDVKYWAKWYVEQGYEDAPRQNLKREDQ
jgi:hypothetical protein